MKNRRRIIWQIYIYLLLICIVSMLAVAWYSMRELKNYHQELTVDNLTAQARIFQASLKQLDLKKDARQIDRLCIETGEQSGTRITVILEDGTVIGDTNESPDSMENHMRRPEIQSALRGKTQWKVRYSDTLGLRMMYLATPYSVNNNLLAVVRTAIPVTTFEKTLQEMQWRIILGVLSVTILAALVYLLVSRRISRPLEELREGIERFASGELDQHLVIPDTEELAALATAMNDMADQLSSRMKTISEQHNRQDAVFNGMVEGVIVVDMSEKIVELNPAAAVIMETKRSEALGRIFHEIVRSHDLHSLLADALSSPAPLVRDICWQGTEDRYFQARAARLHDHEGREFGALVVLNEVTRLFKLETIRRDFVANVSHELRTPITSIQGFSETLLDGALEDGENARHFVEIIQRQARRLNAIVEDLLSLSRIERQAEQGDPSLDPVNVGGVIDSALQSCEMIAADKNCSLDASCPDDLMAMLNGELIERAIINLVENAIKYSDPEKVIRVSAFAEDKNLIIEVSDQGWGIHRDHLDRLFERFYRVDKARSRNLGGTGLGLSIVKHISLLHKGTIGVESTPGYGSTFTITIPHGM